jgi:hypothetical protein
MRRNPGEPRIASVRKSPFHTAVPSDSFRFVDRLTTASRPLGVAQKAVVDGTRRASGGPTFQPAG